MTKQVTYCQLIHGQAKRIDYTPVSADESNFIKKLCLSASGHSFFIYEPFEVLLMDVRLQDAIHIEAAKYLVYAFKYNS